MSFPTKTYILHWCYFYRAPIARKVNFSQKKLRKLNLQTHMKHANSHVFQNKTVLDVKYTSLYEHSLTCFVSFHNKFAHIVLTPHNLFYERSDITVSGIKRTASTCQFPNFWKRFARSTWSICAGKCFWKLFYFASVKLCSYFCCTSVVFSIATFWSDNSAV